MPSSEAGGAPAAARSAFSFEQLAPAPPAPSPAAGRAEAETLVARARADAELIRQQAEARGREEGFRAGMAAAADQIAPARAALEAAAAEVDRLRGDAVASVEREAVELAFEVAEKVLAGALTVEPERVLEVVAGALRGMVDRERVVVEVHPDDLDIVRPAAAAVAASLGGVERLEVQAERRVERGGAVVRTALGEVDARVATKLARAREVVEAELGA